MYKIVGADGQLYGPASAEQIKQWIAEGRANAQTQTLAENTAGWKPLGAFPEFAHYFTAASSIPPLAAGAVRKTNGNALAGFIFGVLSIVCCCKFFFGILGIIFSLIGLSQITRNPQCYEGRGLAISGLVLSLLGFLLAVILMLWLIANGHFHSSWNFQPFNQ